MDGEKIKKRLPFFERLKKGLQELIELAKLKSEERVDEDKNLKKEDV
jgi:hypothetical protein